MRKSKWLGFLILLYMVAACGRQLQSIESHGDGSGDVMESDMVKAEVDETVDTLQTYTVEQQQAY